MLKNERKDTQLYYCNTVSAPCRAVLMVAAALKLKLSLKPIDLMQREHLHPGYLKINPHHTVPALVDNEFTMFESRAICIYLVEKYGKNDALYPKNPKIRAAINQLLYFDMGTLTNRYNTHYTMPFFTGKESNEKNLEALNEAIGFLEIFLKDRKYFVSNRLTIADLIILPSVTTIEAFGYDFSAYENISNWLSLMKETAPGYEHDVEGIKIMKEFIKK